MPTDLRFEYRTDPVGVDGAKPRLGWILQSSARGAAQSAYQILVACSPDVLATDGGDLWDSGRVMSAQMNQLSYGGKWLMSSQKMWWKVRFVQREKLTPGDYRARYATAHAQ